MQHLTQPNNRLLSEDEVRRAGATGVALEQLLATEAPHLRSVTLRISVEQPNGERAELSLPGETLPLLSKILREMGNGKNVVVLASDTEVTTQQAAEFLNVSRPYLVRLLENRRIPFRLVGPRRRVLLEDLLRYKAQEETERHRGLDDLVVEAQKLGMY